MCDVYHACSDGDDSGDADVLNHTQSWSFKYFTALRKFSIQCNVISWSKRPTKPSCPWAASELCMCLQCQASSRDLSASLDGFEHRLVLGSPDDRPVD